uniref:Uncharacterized protein n=1 Tax=Arundo donax TaxID=35708 RepID=A0A0A9ANS0_ARUDO
MAGTKKGTFLAAATTVAFTTSGVRNASSGDGDGGRGEQRHLLLHGERVSFRCC